jgi:hypothetical protein
MARQDRVSGASKKITRVEEKRNVTTNKSITIRLTNLDVDAMEALIEKTQKVLVHKKVSRSRIIRAFGHLYDDDEVVEKIAKSIIENT